MHSCILTLQFQASPTDLHCLQVENAVHQVYCNLKILVITPMQVYKADLRAKIKGAFGVAASMDEVTAGESFMGITVYIINKQLWEREQFYVALAHLTDAPNATYLTETFVDTFLTVTGLSLEELAEKLGNVSCDGASVLQSKKAGVLAKVRIHHTRTSGA